MENLMKTCFPFILSFSASALFATPWQLNSLFVYQISGNFRDKSKKICKQTKKNQRNSMKRLGKPGETYYIVLFSYQGVFFLCLELGIRNHGITFRGGDRRALEKLRAREMKYLELTLKSGLLMFVVVCYLFVVFCTCFVAVCSSLLIFVVVYCFFVVLRSLFVVSMYLFVVLSQLVEVVSCFLQLFEVVC